MNPSLDNAEPQRVGAGVHAYGGADLVNGYLMDGIAVFLKHTKGMVTESGAFFYIIAVSDGNTVAFDTEAAFFQISKVITGRMSKTLPARAATLPMRPPCFKYSIFPTVKKILPLLLIFSSRVMAS